MSAKVIAVFVVSLALHGCGSADDPAEDKTCTAEQTRKLVEAADMTKLLEVAQDDATRSVLLDAVVGSCCPLCGGAPDARAPAAKAEACVACAAAYSDGNPAAHVTACAAAVCGAP